MNKVFSICLLVAVIWALDGFIKFHCYALCKPEGFCNSYLKSRLSNEKTK